MRQGTHLIRQTASARFPAREPKQWRCRRSEAEPHAPTGLSPQVTGGGQTGFPEEIINVSVTDSKHKFVELTLNQNIMTLKEIYKKEKGMTILNITTVPVGIL